MNNKMLSPEQIESNWKLFRDRCNLIKAPRNVFINEMLDREEERICMAPASARLEYHNAFPGGLVDHSLRVFTNAVILTKSFFQVDDISKESIALVALFHDLGKIGDADGNNYYLEQTSSWHRDKLGEVYQVNKNLQFMPHAHRSACLLQRYGVKLSDDEFTAILTHDGQYNKDNGSYSMKETPLSTVISLADLIACKQEKSAFLA